jgi:regulator of RNase E activity RraA
MVGTRVQTLGAEAIVTDGAVRDLEALHGMGMKVWSEYVVVSHGWIDVGEANIPIEVGGLVVRPGDILHADCNGVVSIPRKILADLPKAIDQILENEGKELERMRAEGRKREALRGEIKH